VPSIKFTFDPRKHTVFVPRNPKKYRGIGPIILRSQWEGVFARWCDNNPDVIEWASESVAIPYYDPVRRKARQYYPDFIIKVRGADKREGTWLVEIKPYKEVMKPDNKNNKSLKSKLYENTTYMTNIAKWRAVTDFCKKRGMQFRIITEKELFG
jgi:hypothetical protein